MLEIKEQKVEMYNSIEDAYYDMNNHIDNGWRIYTCISNGHDEKTIVVYEREYNYLVG